MTTLYPTALDNLSNPNPTDITGVFGHAALHSNENDAIEAIQAKVGINGSAVTTTHDYKLSEVTGSDKAVSKAATQTLTNKTLTSPTITGATQSGSTITTSSINGVTPSTSAGATNYLAGDGTYKAVQAPDASYSVKGSVQGLTDAATSGLTLSGGVISVNSGTGANQIVKLDGTSKLPAVDASNLINSFAFNTGVSSTATTTTTINIAHGLGKTPKIVRIYTIGSPQNTYTNHIANSIGIYQNSTNKGVALINTGQSSPAYQGTTTSSLIYISENPGSPVSILGNITAVDSTNFAISYTVTGSPLAVPFMWEAFA